MGEGLSTGKDRRPRTSVRSNHIRTTIVTGTSLNPFSSFERKVDRIFNVSDEAGFRLYVGSIHPLNPSCLLTRTHGGSDSRKDYSIFLFVSKPVFLPSVLDKVKESNRT